MNRSIEGEFLENMLRGPNDEIIDRLSMTCIVDLGIIESIDVNGRATVKSFRMVGDQQVVFSDVEVIGIGNLYGGITAYGGGGVCLILAPKTCMPVLSDGKINTSAVPFSKDGIKALPITNCQGLNTLVQFAADGSFIIQNDESTITISKDLVSISTDSGFVGSLSMGTDLLLSRRTAVSGIYQYTLTDNGEVKSFVNSAGDSQYIFQLLDDGSYTITHNKLVPNQDPEVLNQIQIKKNGATTITLPSEASLSIDADGNISVSTKGNISVSASGANSSVSVNASGNNSAVTISANSFNVNSGHLEVT